MPLDWLVRSYSLCTGATGAGKTYFALLAIQGLIERAATSPFGFGVLDAKGDIYHGTLYLLKQELSELASRNPEAARALWNRIEICDFSSSDPVTPYNILAPWEGADLEFFAYSRADLVLDLLSGGDRLSLGGVATLQRIFQLLCHHELPIGHVAAVIHDELFRARLLEECPDPHLVSYFRTQFPRTPKPTLQAIERRLDSLFSSESVRLALSATSAPDFRRAQDESKIVPVNCAGSNIARSVRQTLQGLVLSDIRHATFARQERDRHFLWLCDEAQNFFLTPRLRENVTDLVTMSRSFGSFMCFLTQNLTTALPDKRLLHVLYTNVRWAFSMRGEPSDADFLQPHLPVTGRRMRPEPDPFAERRIYPEREERALLLAEIANLPDRTGYLWFKDQGANAFQIRTADLDIPSGKTLEEAIEPLRRDPSFGCRVSRADHDQLVSEREARWSENEGNMDEDLTRAYDQIRGGRS